MPLILYPDGDLLALPIGNFGLLNVSRDLLSNETKVSVVATLKKQSLGTVLVFRSVIQKYNVTFNHIVFFINMKDDLRSCKMSVKRTLRVKISVFLFLNKMCPFNTLLPHK